MTKRKLIIVNKASFNGAFIDDGRLGLTGNHKFYILGDKLELMIKVLNFEIMNIIGHYTKYGQDFLDNDAFTYLPDLRKLGINDIIESNFYKLLELTPDELKTLNYISEQKPEQPYVVEAKSEQRLGQSSEHQHMAETQSEQKLSGLVVEQIIKPKFVVKLKEVTDTTFQQQNLTELTLVKLKELAKDNKLRGYSKLKKADLIAMIQQKIYKQNLFYLFFRL